MVPVTNASTWATTQGQTCIFMTRMNHMASKLHEMPVWDFWFRLWSTCELLYYLIIMCGRLFNILTSVRIKAIHYIDKIYVWCLNNIPTAAALMDVAAGNWIALIVFEKLNTYIGRFICIQGLSSDLRSSKDGSMLIKCSLGLMTQLLS